MAGGTSLGAAYVTIRGDVGQLQKDMQTLDTKFTKLQTTGKNTEKSLTSSFDKATNAIKGMALALGAGMLLKGFYDTINAAQTMANKIKVSTDGTTSGMTKALTDIKNVSLETYSSLDSNVSFYQKAITSMGLSHQDAIKTMTVFNQTLAVGGASTEEAAASVLQFGQAMASGRLQGDEFRSMTENNSFFMTKLAEVLGLTRAELKKMASEGRVTSDVLLQATREMADGVADRFSKMDLTIKQGMELVKTVFNSIMIESVTSSGGVNAISEAFRDLAKTMDANREPIKRFFVDLIELAGAAVKSISYIQYAIDSVASSYYEQQADMAKKRVESIKYEIWWKDKLGISTEGLSEKLKEEMQERTRLLSLAVNGIESMQKSTEITAGTTNATKGLTAATKDLTESNGKSAKELLAATSGTQKLTAEQKAAIRHTKELAAAFDTLNNEFSKYTISTEKEQLAIWYEKEIRKAKEAGFSTKEYTDRLGELYDVKLKIINADEAYQAAPLPEDKWVKHYEKMNELADESFKELAEMDKKAADDAVKEAEKAAKKIQKEADKLWEEIGKGFSSVIEDTLNGNLNTWDDFFAMIKKMAISWFADIAGNVIGKLLKGALTDALAGSTSGLGSWLSSALGLTISAAAEGSTSAATTGVGAISALASVYEWLTGATTAATAATEAVTAATVASTAAATEAATSVAAVAEATSTAASTSTAVTTGLMSSGVAIAGAFAGAFFALREISSWLENKNPPAMQMLDEWAAGTRTLQDTTVSYFKAVVLANDGLLDQTAEFAAKMDDFSRYSVANLHEIDNAAANLKMSVAAASGALDWLNMDTSNIDSVTDAINRLNKTSDNTEYSQNLIKQETANYEARQGRAVGGPVGADQSYWVGENGPEMFTPQSAGTITPNGGSAGGQDVLDELRQIKYSLASRQQVLLTLDNGKQLTGYIKSVADEVRVSANAHPGTEHRRLYTF